MGKILVSFMLLCLIESGKKDFSRFTVWHSFFKNEKSNLAHTQLAFWNDWRHMAVSKFLEQIFLFLDHFNLVKPPKRWNVGKGPDRFCQQCVALLFSLSEFFLSSLQSSWFFYISYPMWISLPKFKGCFMLRQISSAVSCTFSLSK